MAQWNAGASSGTEMACVGGAEEEAQGSLMRQAGQLKCSGSYKRISKL